MDGQGHQLKKTESKKIRDSMVNVVSTLLFIWDVSTTGLSMLNLEIVSLGLSEFIVTSFTFAVYVLASKEFY